jgi:hypothetical protein
MADNGSHPSSRHRHAHRAAPVHRRRRMLLIAVGVIVAIAAVLVVLSWDRSSDAVAERTVALTTTTATPPASPPAPTPAPAPTLAPAPAQAASETATTSDVPAEFAAAMQQIGIPLDPHTGWIVAQGICVRLGQPQYDQFRMSEGVERLFPSVPDEQAHAFVAMVAESVCHL